MARDSYSAYSLCELSIDVFLKFLLICRFYLYVIFSPWQFIC